jgi:hypothetical protein
VTLDEAYRSKKRVVITHADGTVERGRVGKSRGLPPFDIYILLKRIDSMGGLQVREDDISRIEVVK